MEPQTASIQNSAPLLQGRVALVTGASRGIGAATAKLLAQHGAAVGVNYNANAQAAQAVVEAIEAAGGRAVAVQGDVGDAAQIDMMVEKVTDSLGPIDTLVLNAAAVREFTIAPFVQLTWEQYEEFVLGETRAIFLPAKAVVPGMIERQHGCIIAVSSALSRTARVGMAGHSSGKAAVDALVRSLATELGPHGIRVNAVAPGLVQTEASASVWSPQPPRAQGPAEQPPHGGPPMMTTLAQMTPLRRIRAARGCCGRDPDARVRCGGLHHRHVHASQRRLADALVTRVTRHVFTGVLAYVFYACGGQGTSFLSHIIFSLVERKNDVSKEGNSALPKANKIEWRNGMNTSPRKSC